MVNLFNFKSVENFASEEWEHHTIHFYRTKDYGTLEIKTGDIVDWTYTNSNERIAIDGPGVTDISHNKRMFTRYEFNQEGEFAYKSTLNDKKHGIIKVTNRQPPPTTDAISSFFGRPKDRTATTAARPATTAARQVTTTARPRTTAARPRTTDPEPAGLSTGAIIVIVNAIIWGVALLFIFYQFTISK